MVPIMLPTEFYLAISRVMVKYDISKSAAILLVINDGLKKHELLTDEIYDIFQARYSRSLLSIVQEGRDAREKPKVRCTWAAGSRADRCRRLAVVKMEKDGQISGVCPGHLAQFMAAGWKIAPEKEGET